MSDNERTPEAIVMEKIPPILNFEDDGSEGPLPTTHDDAGIILLPIALHPREIHERPGGLDILHDTIYQLRYCHRKRIPGLPHRNPPNRFSHAVEYWIVRPVLDLLNQVRPSYLDPLEVKMTVDMKDRNSFVVAEMEGGGETRNCLTVVFMHPSVLNLIKWESESEIMLDLPHQGLSRVLAECSNKLAFGRTSYILITDTQNVVAIRVALVACDSIQLHYKKLPISDQEPLRLTITAFIQESFPRGQKYLDLEVVTNRWSRGALNDPTKDLESDSIVFKTHTCHSDFDLFAVEQDPAHKAQFLRWKEQMKNMQPKSCNIGDKITAETHGFARRNFAMQPRYEPEPLPQSTTDYLQSAKRYIPTEFSEIGSSSQFSIQLTRELTKNLTSGFSLAFACDVITVDGKPLSGVLTLPPLCVKFFDDRLSPVDETPSSLRRDDGFPLILSQCSSEELVAYEDAAYRILAQAQGSLIPMYFGAHLFTMPDGIKLYGVVMELAQGPTLDEKPLVNLADETQIEFIRASRHFVRLMQSADIRQTDWWSGQIICLSTTRGENVPSAAKHVGPVFFDFSATQFGEPGYDLPCDQNDDYGEVVQCLLVGGIRKELLKQHFEPRENWDYYITDIDTLEDLIEEDH
ncbi:hypothetical protein BD410DRAFT_895283 [Rickenella mellea]|uniref:Uncharacterized protein n=1 Tax=Rickenella mellea TaxID=50990 RepID=A0A4Y7QHA4_9AGAM|nr:hypothetical protein BD410DRAFT_895283 [Rickenella mellea]